MSIPKAYRYDPSGVLGSGCSINVVTGARSFGKTYAWKKQGIKRFLKNGQTWGYLRTFDQEIKDILADGPFAFFGDIMRNNEFPGYTFKMSGRKMMCGRITKKKDKDGEAIVEWSVMGQMFALTKAQSYKGKTVANMTLLVFDEFIRENRVPPYPSDCVGKLYSLWETLDRRENRVRIVMLANAADAVNPYFVTWRITPPELGEHKRVQVGASYIYVENCWNNEFAKYADDSEIGKLTRGSSYSTYAMQNHFANVTGNFVKPLPRRVREVVNIVWGSSTFCFMRDLESSDGYYVDGKAHNNVDSIVLMRSDQTPDYVALGRSDPLMRDIVRMARYGLIWFPNDSVRERFGRVLEMCGFH